MPHEEEEEKAKVQSKSAFNRIIDEGVESGRLVKDDTDGKYFVPEV